MCGFIVWKKTPIFGKPDGNLSVPAGGGRAILFLGVCSSKKRDIGHKMFVRGSNTWRRGFHPKDSGGLEQAVQRGCTECWALLYVSGKDSPFQPGVIH